MLYEILVTLYIFVCALLALLILIQKGKSSMGLGGFGGGGQMLFGGSGGQDVFQKITWGLGAIFIIGSLSLAMMKTQRAKQFKYAIEQKEIAAQQMPMVSQSQDKVGQEVSADSSTEPSENVA